MKFSIIGSGNVAHLFAHQINKSKHSVQQVYSRNKRSGKLLSKLTGADFINQIDLLESSSDVYIIAVNDDEIKSVADTINLKNKTVIHTSGSTPLSILKKCSRSRGVVYPVVSILKDKNDLPENYTVCVEANTDTAYKKCLQTAKLLSHKVVKLTSKKREALHLAAVMVNNFSNHLFTLSENYLQKHHVNFNLLDPLIQQTAIRITRYKASTLQTGPAARNDKKTINKHLSQLKDDKVLCSLYKLFTKSIVESYK
jgi:predicted short-subunit dehydrogenase-like oxidoreductase (DUF2520 family)